MLTMTEALVRLKANCAEVLPERLIEQTCVNLELQFRRRTLTPVVTTYLFLQQVLNGNPAVGELRHLSKLEFTAAAYCQARNRLPVRFFQRLQRAVTGRCRRDDHLSPDELWHGHRVFLADGSSFSMPDKPELQDLFGQPSGQAVGCGFPTAHLLTLFDAHSGWLLKAIPAAWNTHDLSQVALLHPELQAGDVLVGDTAFCSYAHLAWCKQRHLHGLFRGHQRTIFDFQPGRPHVPPGIHPKKEHKGMPRSRWIKRLGKHDQVVE
jgi:Transposase DDE domain